MKKPRLNAEAGAVIENVKVDLSSYIYCCTPHFAITFENKLKTTIPNRTAATPLKKSACHFTKQRPPA
jgi:hypothetical protein